MRTANVWNGLSPTSTITLLLEIGSNEQGQVIVLTDEEDIVMVGTTDRNKDPDRDYTGLTCLWTRCIDCGVLMWIDADLGFGVMCQCPGFEVPLKAKEPKL